MQLTNVRIGRFYMHSPKGYAPEKVLAYGVLRETGKAPLVTVKNYEGTLFHVPARQLSPIATTPAQDMAKLISFADGVCAGQQSLVDVGRAHVDEYRARERNAYAVAIGLSVKQR